MTQRYKLLVDDDGKCFVTGDDPPRRWLVRVRFDGNEVLSLVVHAESEDNARRKALYYASTYLVDVTVVGERRGLPSEDHIVGKVVV